MEIRPELVQELRLQFKDGATPSRLIRFIAEAHVGDNRLHGLIQLYFLEAFGIPIVRGLQRLDDYEHNDLRFAYLNRDIVHDIVMNKAEWDEAKGAGTWFESVEAKSDRARFDSIHPEALPSYQRFWELLTPKEQDRLRWDMASSGGHYESVQVLSQLVERLQQRINELEEAVAPEMAADGLATSSA